MKKLVPYAVVVLLPFLLYWKLFHPDSEERQIFRGDFLNQHYVWKSYALSRVKNLELPLWNPHILGGEAFHANPQAGIFYPPTYLLLPFHSDGRVSYLALEAYQLLHQAFGGLGMLFLLRSFGVGTVGALGAAVIFMFTGFFTTPGHQAIVLTASFLPWVLLAIRRLFETSEAPSPIRSILLALSVGMMILAGHPQVAYYGLLLACAFALFEGGWRESLFRFLPALLLGIGVAFVQLLPTYGLARESSRVELGYEYSTSFGFAPYFLSAILAPRGQVALPGQDGAAPLHVYVGIGTLLFAFLGVFFSKNRARVFFAAAALIALLLSFGKDSPIYDFFYASLPGLGSFRVPYRLLGIWSLGCSVVAGLGIEALVSSSRKDRLRFRSVASGAFVALLALSLWAALLHTRLLSSPASQGSLEPRDLERVVGSAHWAVLLGALHFLLFLLFLWRPQDRCALPAMVALLAIDMAAFVKDRAQHPYGTLARADDRPVHRFLKAQGPKGRYATPSGLESYSMLFGTELAGGHATLVDARYQALLDRAASSANALSILNVKLVVRSDPASAYPWCGARYASPLPILDLPPELTPATISLAPPIEAARVVFYWTPLGGGGAGIIEIAGVSHPLVDGRPLAIDFGEPTVFSEFRVLVREGNPGIRIDDVELDLNPIGLKIDFLSIDGIGVNLHAIPRAYFIVPSSVPSEIQTADSLACWSVHQGIQVEDPVTGEGASGFFRKDAAEIVKYEPELVEIETTSSRDGFLVVSDTYRPEWRALVDGSPVGIWRAQTAFRAVRVPAGKHRAVFLYRPDSLRVGAVVSGFALLVLAAWPAISWFRRRRSTPTLDEIPLR